MSRHFALIRAPRSRREDVSVCSHVVIYIYIPEYKAKQLRPGKGRRLETLPEGNTTTLNGVTRRCFRNPSLHLLKSILFVSSSCRQDIPNALSHRLKTRVRQHRSIDLACMRVSPPCCQDVPLSSQTSTTIDHVCMRVSPLCC